VTFRSFTNPIFFLGRPSVFFAKVSQLKTTVVASKKL
jgi:hypothetical protein